jgi:hypothetical protein
MSLFSDYRKLLSDLDRTLAATSAFGNTSQCPQGCASCCGAFSLLPIEAGLIASEGGAATSASDAEHCPFLTAERLCSAYSVRPMICRVRGFPIFCLDAEGRPSFEVCRNSISAPGYAASTALRLDQWNARLYRINARFCQETGIPPHRLAVHDLHRWAVVCGKLPDRPPPR